MSASDNAPVTILQRVRLDQAALAFSEAHIEHGPNPVITTAAQRWSYAAALPLGVDPAGGANLAVEARLCVLEGRVGIGVLAADEQSFVVEKEVAAKDGLSACLVLRLPCPPVVGPLIVRNVSEAGRSVAILEQVVILRLPPPERPGESTGIRASEPTQAELPQLIRSLEYLRPLVPYPGWRFDSDWDNPDFSFQIRRRLWDYCFSKRWDISVDIPWYSGVRVEVPLLSDMGRQLFVGGCIDPNEFVFLDGILKPEMVFVDVGAHLGLYTLYAAHRTSAVWAFEPSSREFACLQRNLHRNNLDNVQALQLALGNSDQTAEMHIAEPMHSGQNTLRAFTHAGVSPARVETVEIRRLDGLVGEQKLDRIDVLKVDVEQFELEVLQGAVGVLRSMQPWLLLEVTQATATSTINRSHESLDLLRDLGYVFYVVGSRSGLIAEAGSEHLPENLIACPARRPLPEDVLSARKYYFDHRGAKGA